MTLAHASFRSFTLALLACALPAEAGFFTLAANGSYFKQNYGEQSGEAAYSISKRGGASISYSLASSTSLKLGYTYGNTQDVGAYDIDSLPDIYYITKTTEVHNLSVNLVLEFADKKSTFRPFIAGGGGYSVYKISQKGRAVNRITDTEATVEFASSPEVKSVAADASIGSIAVMCRSETVRCRDGMPFRSARPITISVRVRKAISGCRTSYASPSDVFTRKGWKGRFCNHSRRLSAVMSELLRLSCTDVHSCYRSGPSVSTVPRAARQMGARRIELIACLRKDDIIQACEPVSRVRRSRAVRVAVHGPPARSC